MKEKLEVIFSMARIHQVNSAPKDENGLIEILNLKSELFKVLDDLEKTKLEVKK